MPYTFGKSTEYLAVWLDATVRDPEWIVSIDTVTTSATVATFGSRSEAVAYAERYADLRGLDLRVENGGSR